MARFLVGSPFKDYNVFSVFNSPDQINQDKVNIDLTFADGSIASIHYLANGAKEFQKERIEIFSEGKILQLNNFRTLIGYGWPNFKKLRTLRQEKGQKECVQAFIESLKKGHAPIPPEELFEVSRLSIQLAQEVNSRV